MSSILPFECDGEGAAAAFTQALDRRGCLVVRSFDLRAALATHMDCECPYHGTAQCTCQFLVLLVYGQSGAPIAVTAHSRGAQTRMQVGQDANSQPDPRLVELIMAALFEAALAVHASNHPAGVSADA